MTPRLSLITALVAVAGCAGVPHTAADAGARAQCAADGQGQWLRADRHIPDLLLMGEVQDPGRAGGRLIPTEPFLVPGGEPEVWMARTGLGRIDMYLRPYRGLETKHLYGPKLGQPEGVYRFEKRPEGSADCRDYDEARAAAAQIRGGSAFAAPIAECIAWRYVGPYRPGEHAVTYIKFNDAAYRTSEVDRSEYGLITADGQTIARGGYYTYRNFNGYLPDCFARSGGVEKLFN